ATAWVSTLLLGRRWVSWGVRGAPDRGITRLYVDPAPFALATGKPQNQWRLLSAYVDVEGVSTGQYSKLADWGGWQTTVRTDGIHDLDFALLSVREIMPPP